MTDDTKKKAVNLSTDLGAELEKEAEERRKKKLAAKRQREMNAADSLSRGNVDTLKVPK